MNCTGLPTGVQVPTWTQPAVNPYPSTHGYTAPKGALRGVEGIPVMGLPWEGIIIHSQHQQIPYFGTVPTVITVIVQYLTALDSAYSIRCHRVPVPWEHSTDTVRLQYVLHKTTSPNFSKSHRLPHPHPHSTTTV